MNIAKQLANHLIENEECVKDLADRILNECGQNIKFIELAIPNSVEKSENIRSGDIIVRYIEDYHPVLNKLLRRWDVLVQKV